MSYPGPPPKPTVIRKAEGNPSRRPFNEREPQPAAVRPKMPKHLDERAQKEWKRLCPMLLRLGLLTEADSIALANLCVDLSILQQAQESLGKAGLLTKTAKTGMIHQSPLLEIIAATADRVMRSLREFGMTPASRTRISVSPDRTMDSLEAKLCQMKRSG